jgi:hypothetical protein
MNPNEEDVEGIKSLIEAGSEITGSAAGAAIGFLLGGVAGAAIGGASIPLLTRGLIEIGNDIDERFLSKREKIRIGGVISYATIKIQEKLAAGEKRRDNGFFEQPSTGHPACAEIPIIERPPAEEVIEGILLSVQREHEEKKLPFIGNLMANIFFEPNIDRMQANLMIRISQSISYRQLCILSIFEHTEDFALLKESDYRGEDRIDFKLVSLFQEICDLWTQGILNCSGEANLSLRDVNPSKMRIQGMGILLYNLMELWEIDEEDIESIVTLLRK